MDTAQLERLAVLSEELGEVQQVIGKILRHGYDSYNPFDESKQTNREKLEIELGDLLLAIGLLAQEEDISEIKVENQVYNKVEKLNKWLHHNKVEYDNGDIKRK